MKKEHLHEINRMLAELAEWRDDRGLGSIDAQRMINIINDYINESN
jgi:hypothetical protein